MVNGGKHIVNSDSRLIKNVKTCSFLFSFLFILCQLFIVLTFSHSMVCIAKKLTVFQTQFLNHETIIGIHWSYHV